MSLYNAFTNLMSKVRELEQLNIVMDSCPFQPVRIKDQSGFYAYDSLMKDVRSGCVFGLTQNPTSKQVCTLALAVTQENQNDYITDSQIKTVNDFFQFDEPITYEEVQEFNSKYI